MKSAVRRSTISSICFAIALSTAVSLWPRVSMAEEPVKDLDWAHQQFNKALVENNKRNYAEAIKILVEVWPRYKSYDVASELGRAEGELGHVAIGAKYTAYAFAHAPPREGKEFKSIHASRVAYAKQRIYFAKLDVTPSDLTVAVNGVDLDVPADIGLYLEPGTHRIEFKKAGYVAETRSIDAKANVQETLVANLAKEPSSEPSSTQPAIASGKSAPPVGTQNPAPFVEPPKASSDSTLSWTILGVGSGLTAIAVGAGVYYTTHGH